MVPHFFEFYIPVLKVLSTIEEKNINNIIDESSYSVGLSAEDKKITTKKNGQPQYRINISWAISDLYQAGFIDRVSRGTYVITIEGLEFLENHPENPTRAILAEKSGKFRDFINKTRVRKSKGETSSPISSRVSKTSKTNKTEEASHNRAVSNTKRNVTPDVETSVLLQELYQTLSILRKANLSTHEIEQKIKELETESISHDIAPKVSKLLDVFNDRIGHSGTITIQYKYQDSMSISLDGQTYTIKIKKDTPAVSVPENKNISSIPKIPKTKKTKDEKPAASRDDSIGTAINNPSSNSGGVWIKPHTDLTFAVYGDTAPFNDLFKSYGGCFRQNNSGKGCWVFMNNRREGLERDLKDYLIEPQSDISNAKKSADNSLKNRLNDNGSNDHDKPILEKYKNQLRSLKSFDFLGVTGPHKAILLLAIFELIYKNILSENKIYYTAELEELYNKKWRELVGTAPTLGSPYPYAHLGKEPFIKQILIRQIRDYNDIWNKQKIRQYIWYSQIDQTLFNLLKKKKYHAELSALLISEYTTKSVVNTSVSYQITKDKINHRSGFHDYMLSKRKSNGDYYQSSSVNIYLGALSSQFVNDIVSSILPSGDIFDISELTVLKRIERLISTANTESRISVTHKSAIRMYIQYIQEFIKSK